MSSSLNIHQRVPTSDNPDTSSPEKKPKRSPLLCRFSCVLPKDFPGKEQRQLVTHAAASAGPNCGQGRLDNGHSLGDTSLDGTDVPMGSVTELRALKT